MIIQREFVNPSERGILIFSRVNNCHWQMCLVELFEPFQSVILVEYFLLHETRHEALCRQGER
jgi:hypothetical protein